MLELTHVHVLFRNSHFANDLNFNVNEPVRVEVEVYVDFATSLLIMNNLRLHALVKCQRCMTLIRWYTFCIRNMEVMDITYARDN